MPFAFIDTGAGAESPTLAGTIELLAQGIGPVFGADAEEIAFGNLSADGTYERVLRLFNLTTDQGTLDLVGLTLLDVVIEGLARELFALSGFVPGTVLGPGESIEFVIKFMAPAMPGIFDDVVLITTDQGAPFCLEPVEACQRGESFALALSGGSIILAEPGPLALLLPLAAVWWLVAPRRPPRIGDPRPATDISSRRRCRAFRPGSPPRSPSLGGRVAPGDSRLIGSGVGAGKLLRPWNVLLLEAH